MKTSSRIPRASLVLAVLLAWQFHCPTQSIAQTPDTLKAPTSYSTFPIIGMGANPDTAEQMLGMNAYWSGYGADASPHTLASESHPVDSMITLRDPFYYDSTKTDTAAQHAFYDIVLEAASTNDIRVFMPGTSGITREYGEIPQ